MVIVYFSNIADSLQASLDSSLLNDFIAALEQLTNPEMVFKVCFEFFVTATEG